MSNLVVSNISDGSTSVGTDYVVNGSAKAWIDVSSSSIINASFNVTSGTDHGTGDYSYALTSSMLTENYSLPVSAITGNFDRNATANGNRITASVMAVITSNARLNIATDQSHNAIIHGDLA